MDASGDLSAELNLGSQSKNMQEGEESTPKGAEEPESVQPVSESEQGFTEPAKEAKKVYEFYHQHFGVAIKKGAGLEVGNADNSGRNAYASTTEVADKPHNTKSDSWHALKNLVRYQQSTTSDDHSGSETSGNSFEAQWFGKQESHDTNEIIDATENVRRKWGPVAENDQSVEQTLEDLLDDFQDDAERHNPSDMTVEREMAEQNERAELSAHHAHLEDQDQSSSQYTGMETATGYAGPEMNGPGDSDIDNSVASDYSEIDNSKASTYSEIDSVDASTNSQIDDSDASTSSAITSAPASTHSEIDCLKSSHQDNLYASDRGIADSQIRPGHENPDSSHSPDQEIPAPSFRPTMEVLDGASPHEEDEIPASYAAEARSKFGSMNAFERLQKRTKAQSETKEEQRITGDIPEAVKPESGDNQKTNDTEGATIMNQWCSSSTGESIPSLSELDSIPTPSVLKNSPPQSKPFSINTPKVADPNDQNAATPDSVRQAAARASWLKAASEYSASVIKAVTEQVKNLNAKPKKVTPESPEFNTEELPPAPDDISSM